jgi:hypothetical protein
MVRLPGGLREIGATATEEQQKAAKKGNKKCGRPNCRTSGKDLSSDRSEDKNRDAGQH